MTLYWTMMILARVFDATGVDATGATGSETGPCSTGATGVEASTGATDCTGGDKR